MRSNWKKRLGVCGGLTLLCLTVFSSALVSPAGAQVATAEFDVTVHPLLTNLHPDQFSFQVSGSVTGVGAPQAWPLNGTARLMLPVDEAYTIIPVPMDGFTDEVVDAPPSITCTNVTLDPAAATPAFCLVNFSAIPPTTTTVATTTTTTVPKTTTTGKVGQTTVSGSHADSNHCTSHLEPNLQPDGKLRIGVTLASDASPQPHFGDPITLSGTTVKLSIPAGLIQLGVNFGLVKNGDQVPSTVTVVVAGSNTTEGTHTFVIHTVATIKTVKVPVSKTYPTGEKALPLIATLPMADSHWTPVSGTADVAFSQKSLLIVASLNVPGIGKVVVTFPCKPNSTASFIALGATGAPTTTAPVTLPPPGGSTPGGGATGGLAAGGATELPRTGSSPWPLLVVAAALIDLGMLAIAGTKRRRRALHR